MRREHLLRLFAEAQRLTGHREYVVIGSLSALGIQDEGELPLEMAMSNDVDAYTLADPGRIFDMQADLGEGSGFHRLHGFFLDPVSPDLPSLPHGWQKRMSHIEQGELRIWFLDPDDAAISKYARSQPNDLRWIRAGIGSGLVSLPRVRARMASTVFLDADEEARVRQQVEADEAWFEDMKKARLNRRASAPSKARR